MHFPSTDQNFDDAQLLVALAAAYAVYGQFETAMRFLDLSRHLLQENSDVVELEAAILAKSGETDRALEKIDMLDQPLNAEMISLQKQLRGTRHLLEKQMGDAIFVVS